MKEFKIRLGKVLVAFSFVLLLLGFSFNIDASKKNVFEVKSNTNNIPSTTVDDSNSENGKNSDVGSNTPVVENPNSSTPIGNVGSSSATSGNNGTGVIGTPNTSTPSEYVPSTQQSQIQNDINQANAILRSSIEDKFGIKIKYGAETDGYTVGGYNTVKVESPNIIYSALLELQNNMTLYPTNFFKEMRTGGLPLTIYLIQRYSNKYITGITEKTNNGVIISIALDFSFADTFHHENYHYIEHYIYLKGGGYSNWNSYNPSGFIYGIYDNSTVYDSTFSEDSYFVNTYAQSYEYEDRASTFEYMMQGSKISPLNYGKNIWLKGKVMCETIDYYFNTVNANTTEYWERYIYAG